MSPSPEQALAQVPDPQRGALERALGAQYEIMRLLGRGGMGAVYLARERALDRLVAIKVLPPEVAADPESQERFRREARTAAKLTHPNIVPLHAFGDAEGMLYFVMGYVKGESLAQRMRREGKLPEEDVRRILGEIADALGYAHKQGVVHRDIKPDNILLEDETGRPMLTDFGVAKARALGTTLTEAGAVVGTPHYMSPEQASGARDLDGRSDLYSLGVMGYQMLAGRLPFEGESFRDVIVQHVTQEPAPLLAVAPESPSELAEAVTRCLAKDPAARWADGHQLRTALDATDDEYEVPAKEARLEAAGFWGLVSVWIGAVAGLATYLFPGTTSQGQPWWWFPAALAASGPVGLALISLTARLRGVRWPAIRRRVLHPPRWWPFWWPRRWRRPGDVWDRLPGVLRWSRILTGAATAVVFVLSVPLLLMLIKGSMGRLRDLAVVLLVGPVYVVIGAAVAPLFWARRHGIEEEHYSRIVFEPTSRLAVWRKAKFAALLLPRAGRAAAAGGAEPRSATELADAIGDLAGQLPAGPWATVSDAAAAARQVVSLVAALDAELANLARDADPQELEAVEAKLRALGPGDAHEGEVRRQKRALLVNQRDLLRRLDERLAALTDRRARLVELLRTMWLQLANLRAEAARDTLAVTEVSERVKALCLEISAQVESAATLRMETP